MLEVVARSRLVNYVGHDACQKLSLDRLQLINLAQMHFTNCRQIAFIWSPCPRCIAESFAPSPLFVHLVQDACQKLSLDRLQLITLATIYVRNCRQIAFRYSRFPRCRVEPFGRSPFVSQVFHEPCQKLSLDRLQSVTVATQHAKICRQITLVSHGVHDAWSNLSLDLVLLVTVGMMHATNSRKIAFVQSR